MFELPEVLTLARQMRANLTGKTIRTGSLGNSPHKFVWYNRSHEEFAELTQGKTVGEARARGRWLFVPLAPGYILLFGEWGGKTLLHAPGSKVPEKYHLYITFEDGSFLTARTNMWGAMELHEAGQELERQYVKGMKPTPIDPEFTPEYFKELIDSSIQEQKRSVKGLLTQDQLSPGLGNSIAQDIMFRAGLHPRHNIGELSAEQGQVLYQAIVDTVDEVTRLGGRHDEVDLLGNGGGYQRLMYSKAAGDPCPVCGTTVQKMQYLGGSCYVCPTCQT